MLLAEHGQQPHSCLLGIGHASNARCQQQLQRVC
jgi:hypothetical protein